MISNVWGFNTHALRLTKVAYSYFRRNIFLLFESLVFQREGFFWFFSIFFTPFKMFIDGILESFLYLSYGFSLKGNELMSVGNFPVEHICGLIKGKIANVSFVIDHNFTYFLKLANRGGDHMTFLPPLGHPSSLR